MAKINTDALVQHSNYSNLHRIYEDILYKLHFGIISVNADLHVNLINDSAKKFFNLAENTKEIPLKTISSELTEKLYLWQNDPINRTQPQQFVLSNSNAIGHFIPGDLDSDVLAIIIIDEMNRIVQHAQQLKIASLGRFTASIAHELRNPLGAIGHAAQLLRESEHLSKEDVRLTEIITNNCDRMNKIIKNILQLSRRTKSEPEQLILKPFLENFVQEFSRFNKESVDFTIRVSPNNMTVSFDKSQLTQILVNLCENALHYGKSSDGKTKIDLTAEKDAHNTDGLLVRDYGPGVLVENSQQIFEPFYTTSRSGMGMGLFITKELCQANCAQLILEECSGGACFKIWFNQHEELKL